MSTTPNNSQTLVPDQDGMQTPVRTLQHKRLHELAKGESQKSPPILKIPASPMMQRLGYGTCVGVYLMERSPKASGELRSPWAIKKLAKIREMKTNSARLRLEHEASLLKQLDHPNIIGYRGLIHESPLGVPALALEQAEGSLADIIEERHDIGVEEGDICLDPLPSKLITKVVSDISNALRYLHDDMRVIHGDMKSANILISGDAFSPECLFVAKLCDFGVARKLKTDGTIEGQYVGTELWNSMEVVLTRRGDAKCAITSKADIYPFGLTIYEMVALKAPHLDEAEDDLDESCISKLSTAATVGSATDTSFEESCFEEKLDKFLGTRPPLPDIEFDQSYNKVLEVFYLCTEENPSKRPTADEIFKITCSIKFVLDDDADAEELGKVN